MARLPPIVGLVPNLAGVIQAPENNEAYGWEFDAASQSLVN
jgi:hypothetical protein